VTQERSQQIGQLLMGIAVAQMLLFVVGAMRRSYAALALPVFGGLAAVSGLAFWVGYTMATTNWDDPADYPVEEAEGAPPPEAVS
jgi:hypothetical protein